MNVEPAGPADKGGMKKGDVLLTMNGKPAISVIETMDQVAEICPGTAVPVTIRRGDQEMTLSVTIQEFPDG
ncbi:MAG: PDZ domain-containing protein [Symbiopectobacterium sp.]